MLNLGRGVAALMQAELDNETIEVNQLQRQLGIGMRLVGEMSGKFVWQLKSNGFTRGEAMSILIATISREE